jgi:hypothetical protein
MGTLLLISGVGVSEPNFAGGRCYRPHGGQSTLTIPLAAAGTSAADM